MFRRNRREPPQNVEIMQIGDTGVGKTTLANCYVSGAFKKEFDKAVLDSFSFDKLFGKIPVRGTIYDLNGSDEYAAVRKSAYPLKHVIIVMHAVDDNTSYKNVFSKWIPEAKELSPDAKILVVGCKSEQRQEEEAQCDPNSETAKKESLEAGADDYLECSAISNSGISEVYDTATKIALKSIKDSSKHGKKKMKVKCLKPTNR